MIELDIDRFIDRAPGEVFERLSNIDRYREWMTTEGLFRDSVQVSEGPVEEGTEFYDKSSLGKLRGTITEFDPPRRLAFSQVLRRRGTDVFVSRPSYVLEPGSAGTIVHHHAEGELRGVYKLLEPIAYLMARAERQRVLDALENSF